MKIYICRYKTYVYCLKYCPLKAIEHALTNRVAIIQGPPGTGKTFLMTKIAEILLNLTVAPDGPILVITYKNHALDEFLKGLIDNKICGIGDICRLTRKYSLIETLIMQSKRTLTYRLLTNMHKAFLKALFIPEQ